MIPRKFSKASLQEKLIVSLFIAIMESYFPDTKVVYGDSEAEIIVYLPPDLGGGSIHFFSYYLDRRTGRGLSRKSQGFIYVVTLGLSHDFLLQLSRTVSYLLRDYPVSCRVCLGEDDPAFIPFVANGLCCSGCPK